ncbi:unnamed protein product [Mytilus coruscus]|uniref:Uncharacterized protein n=1 Tax=Mytilus coruscus TaxID=42192 RepID=A0A6J8E6I3_MYTCO|nr:unnamed protein product [Mytilus coruscus]
MHDFGSFAPVPSLEGAMGGLGTAFPKATSLRYKDYTAALFQHVLCKESTFIKPDGGWFKGTDITLLCKIQLLNQISWEIKSLKVMKQITTWDELLGLYDIMISKLPPIPTQLSNKWQGKLVGNEAKELVTMLEAATQSKPPNHLVRLLDYVPLRLSEDVKKDK